MNSSKSDSSSILEPSITAKSTNEAEEGWTCLEQPRGVYDM